MGKNDSGRKAGPKERVGTSRDRAMKKKHDIGGLGNFGRFSEDFRVSWGSSEAPGGSQRLPEVPRDVRFVVDVSRRRRVLLLIWSLGGLLWVAGGPVSRPESFVDGPGAGKRPPEVESSQKTWRSHLSEAPDVCESRQNTETSKSSGALWEPLGACGDLRGPPEAPEKSDEKPTKPENLQKPSTKNL